jgi:hypothetical protein
MRWRPHVRDYSPGVSDRRISRMLICRVTKYSTLFSLCAATDFRCLSSIHLAVFAISLSLCGSGVLVPLKLAHHRGPPAVATASSKVVAYTSKTVPIASTPRSFVTR